MSSDRLLLGPLLRHVDETSASVWVETKEAASVTLQAFSRKWTASTFRVHDRHYALVEVSGLAPGTASDYTVDIDGECVWPPTDSEFPPSRIATLEPERALRMAFGSCRTSVAHDRAGNRSHGVDALRAYAFHLAGQEPQSWPDLVLFLGDQVYADETSDEMQRFIASRRNIEEPPGTELKDYEEYAYLYWLAWTDPANRWLFSTLPSAMIFDDHDIRDDWNTSASWREKMNKTSWWHERIVAGLASYWVYQHLGNMSPADRAQDVVWQRILEGQASGGRPDFGPMLDELAAAVDERPETYRWSYSRDLGGSRLVVVDSRAARVLEPDRRSILDEDEVAWLDEQVRGDVDHLFIGTSLPYLLSPGLHEVEAWDEAIAEGAWGKRFMGFGERLRQGVDFEHWAAFQEGFRTVAAMVCEVADGKRGAVPSTVTFLSGDVHNSYVAEVERDGACRILQAVCSPIRNPLPRAVRYATAWTALNFGTRAGTWLARRAAVADPPFHWKTIRGPWFDNNIATLEADGRKLWMRWEKGVVHRGDDQPVLELVSETRIDA